MNMNPSGSNPFGPGLPPNSGPAPEPQMVRVAFPRIRPTVTYVLIAVTVVIYLLQQVSMAMFNGNDLLFLFGGKINQFIYMGELWRLITPILLHGSIPHILFNMYALFVLGREVELAYGHGRFLLLYLMGGFAGNVFSFIFTPGSSLGSSTAVFGLVAAEAVFFYQNRRLFGNRTRSVIMNLASIVLINLFIGITPGSGIDNFGHLGGLLGGALFSWLGGPNWKIEGIYPDLHVVDSREQSQVAVGTFTVLIVFGALTALRFFIK
jgi:rhomboid protease GluP